MDEIMAGINNNNSHGRRKRCRIPPVFAVREG
jgi:hypothetical protein